MYGDKMKILVVDDDFVSSSKEAIVERHGECIMDGTEALLNIREIENKENIAKENQVKIIMVTSHSDKNHLLTCLQAGCDGYIVKPFDSKSVSRKIEQLKSKKDSI